MMTYIGSMTLCLLFLLIMCGSVCHGGKLLVFPGEGSHWLNMDILIKALHSQGHTITVDVLDEPSYRMNMQKLSRLHRDVPMEPLDTALFWIEFVMRHKGAAHLRTESYRMPWYSYHSVDVVLLLLGVVSVLILLLVAIVRYLCVRKCLKRKIKSE
uniref:Uncharacterized protein n=1 Tax=Hucho hucho TaxID=62062 RepID=A0A4W5QGZ9_9TELE